MREEEGGEEGSEERREAWLVGWLARGKRPRLASRHECVGVNSPMMTAADGGGDWRWRWDCRAIASGLGASGEDEVGGGG